MSSIAKRASDSLRNTWFDRTRFGKFIVNVLVELDHVTWPSKDQVVNSAVVVIVTTLIFGVIIGGINTGLLWFFKMLTRLTAAS